ncbi:MAG TPA: SIS domain-containing protein [Gaiellales bacterium]|jgi:glucosamine--fructose-6-phosphate aminotransferase (isomerizing)
MPDLSAMQQTMATQPSQLERILSDTESTELAAERIRGARRILVAGTGTSFHAANHAAYLLRAAGREAWAIEPFAAAAGGPVPVAGDALILLSHRNSKHFTTVLRDAARDHEVRTVVISGIGAGGDIETVEAETSSAFTASHLGAIARVAQIAQALGARLDGLERIPDAVAQALVAPAPRVEPPARLLEFTGAGTNAWTAAEGALKARETSYVATEGLSAEQLLHGPAVALRPGDALVSLDGGGGGAARVNEVADAAERFGVAVTRIVAHDLPEPLSVFPLTVGVQRIALALALTLGTNPDSFGRDRAGHDDAWSRLDL